MSGPQCPSPDPFWRWNGRASDCPNQRGVQKNQTILEYPRWSCYIEKAVPLDYAQIEQCLNEAEQELLRVGRERCNFLRDEGQLPAVILLLLRCVSLFCSMVGEFRSERLDSFDAVRRAFLESWLLAFQFRMLNSSGDVGRWLARMHRSWSADIGDLEEYARSRGHVAPNLGRDYGELSNLAHPTRDAVENSAALITRRLGISSEAHKVEEAIERLEEGIPAMLYRLLWLTLDEHADLIPLNVDERNMPSSVRFVEEHLTVEG